MKTKVMLGVFLSVLILTACAAEATIAPTATPEPTVAPTSTPRPTLASTPEPTDAPPDYPIEDGYYIIDFTEDGFPLSIALPCDLRDNKNMLRSFALNPTIRIDYELYEAAFIITITYAPPGAYDTYLKLLASAENDAEKVLANVNYNSKAKILYGIIAFDETNWEALTSTGFTAESYTNNSDNKIIGEKDGITYILYFTEKDSNGLNDEGLELYNKALELLPEMIEKIRIIK